MPIERRSLLRAFFVIVCLFAIFRSVRMGIADYLVRRGDSDGIVEAIRIEPRNSIWRSRLAVLRFESGDSSSATRDELRSVSRSRPFDAEPLLALGLLDEQLRDFSTAEKEFLQATTADRRLKPAWTLANFYFRIGAYGKMWPQIQHCFSLIQPKASSFVAGGFVAGVSPAEGETVDPASIFKLMVETSADPTFLLSQVPKRREILIPYIEFLSGANKSANFPDPLGAAAVAWPFAIQVAQTADREVLVKFLDQLLRFPDSYDPVPIWNDLVKRKYLVGNRLDREGGVALSDPAFQNATVDRGFGWRIPYADGIDTLRNPHAVTMNFTGAQSEQVDLLSTYAAVLPTRKYRLRWELDPPVVPGLRTLLSGDAGEPLQLDPDVFTTPQKIDRLRVVLQYKRPIGQTRLRRSIAIRGLALELLP